MGDIDEIPHRSPRAAIAPATPQRRRGLRWWLTLATIAVVAAPILFGLELMFVYILQAFGIEF